MRTLGLCLVAILTLAAAACSREADVVSSNLSVAADQFEIERRITFYNGITGEDMLILVGRCSLGNNDDPGELTVTCKDGPESYKKHLLGLSDNVTYFFEQIEAAPTDPWRYRVIFHPSSLVPNLDLMGTPPG